MYGFLVTGTGTGLYSFTVTNPYPYQETRVPVLSTVHHMTLCMTNKKYYKLRNSNPTPHTMAISKTKKKQIPTKSSAIENSHTVSQSKRKTLEPKQSKATYRRSSVQDSDEEEEPSHIGDVLSSDVDHVMESIDDNGSTIEVSDGENDDEYTSKRLCFILKRNLLTVG